MSLINSLTRGLIYKDGESQPHRKGRSSYYSKNEGSKYWVDDRLRNLIKVFIPLFPVWVLSRFQVTWAMKKIGKALGSGSCSCCGMPWRYVRGATINYSETSGMFPICVSCFRLLTPDQIDFHIEKLVSSWRFDNKEYGFERAKEQTPEEVIVAAKAEMRRMKLFPGSKKLNSNLVL